MPDADKNVAIKITTLADTAGAKKTAQALAEVEKATKGSSGAAEEGGKKAEFLGLKFGELKKITRELGQEFPIAGYAARLMLNPIAAAFTIAIGIFAKAKDSLDEWNKKMDEAAEKAAEPTFAEGIKARKEVLEKAAESAEAYRDHLIHIIDAETQYQNAVRDSIATSNQLAEARGKLNDAQQGLDTEMLKRQFEAGLITWQQYFDRLTAMQKKYEADKLAREKAAHAAELKALTDDLNHLTFQQHAHEGDGQVARDRETKANTTVTNDESNLKALVEKFLPEAQQRQKDAEAALKNSGLSIGEIERAIKNDPQGTEIWQKQLEELNKANADIAQFLGQIQSRTKRLPGERSDAAAAGRDAGHAEARNEELIKSIEALTREIDNLKTKYGISESTDATTAAQTIHQKLLPQPVGGGFSGGDVELAAQLEQQKALFARHTAGVKDLTDAQKKWLDVFEKFAGINGGMNDRQLALLYQIVGSQTDAVTKVASLEKEMKALRDRQKNQPTGTVHQ